MQLLYAQNGRSKTVIQILSYSRDTAIVRLIEMNMPLNYFSSDIGIYGENYTKEVYLMSMLLAFLAISK